MTDKQVFGTFTVVLWNLPPIFIMSNLVKIENWTSFTPQTSDMPCFLELVSMMGHDFGSNEFFYSGLHVFLKFLYHNAWRVTASTGQCRTYRHHWLEFYKTMHPLFH